MARSTFASASELNTDGLVHMLGQVQDRLFLAAYLVRLQAQVLAVRVSKRPLLTNVGEPPGERRVSVGIQLNPPCCRRESGLRAKEGAAMPGGRGLGLRRRAATAIHAPARTDTKTSPLGGETLQKKETEMTRKEMSVWWNSGG